ncbi:MAG: UpxY family transcription antiterminator [Owenweeksia sp.]|nr:UpxY family transcription antiterminator [Owenweeksia sp.]
MNTQLQWYAVYVKSRNEKKVAERFEARGLACYCPLHTVTRQWSDRRKKVREPLFKSYVFVQSNTSTRLTVLQTPGVVGFVNWLGRPAVIRNSEIDAIRIFLED